MLSQNVPMHFGNGTILAQVWAKPCPFCICPVVTMALRHCSDRVVWKQFGAMANLQGSASYRGLSLRGLMLLGHTSRSVVLQQVRARFDEPFPSLTTWQPTIAPWVAMVWGIWFKLHNISSSGSAVELFSFFYVFLTILKIFRQKADARGKITAWCAVKGRWNIVYVNTYIET